MDKLKDVKYYVNSYLREFLEIFIFYALYALLTGNSKFEIFKAIKIAGLVGIVSVILQEYNQSSHSNMKAGIFSLIGTSVLKL
jgi:hypothetical protein